MDNLFEEFTILLGKNGLSRKDVQHWNCFNLFFGGKDKSNIDKEKSKAKDKVNNEIKGSTKGIYIFFNSKGQCLYIGKAKDLSNRILGHYYLSLGYKSFKSKIDDKTMKYKDWVDFFSKDVGECEIRWKEIDEKDNFIGETLRIICERILIAEYLKYSGNKEPLFENLHPSEK